MVPGKPSSVLPGSFHGLDSSKNKFSTCCDPDSNRIPQFGRTPDDIYFVHGFSGHGVALAGQAGVMLAEAVIGDQTGFNVLSSLNHMPFPGGPLRIPALALGMAYYKLRDRLKI